MNTRLHMQDQVDNRVADLMNETKSFNWDEVFQNASTFSLIIVFLGVGLNW